MARTRPTATTMTGAEERQLDAMRDLVSVIAVVRSEYPDSAWEVWAKNFAEQPDEVTESTHVRRLIKAVLAYDATRQEATDGR